MADRIAIHHRGLARERGSQFPMYRSRLLGIGMSVPQKVVTNHDLSTMMETSHEWIVERSGIETRRWVSPGETGASLGTAAAKEAIQRAGLEPKDIDLLIYATLSPDFNFPGTGVFVQRVVLGTGYEKRIERRTTRPADRKQA